MSVTSPSSSSAPLKGILLVLTAVLLFASMDTAGKYLMTKFNVPLVAAVRYSLNLVILSALMMPRHGKALWKTNRTALVALRGMCLAGATFFSGMALQLMPVGETVAILYLQGFGIMIAAGLFLKERVGRASWIAAAVGFLGVLLIARPGGALAPLGVVFALSASGVSVAYILLSRALSATESTMAMLFHVATTGSVVFGALWFYTFEPFSYSSWDIVLLIYLGAVSLLAHALLTSAYRFATASMLAPFNYFHIAFAIILGWLVYDHLPDGWSMAGMAMIAVSGAAVALHTHLANRPDVSP
jgi:drug/metabolite transporter (DMT)-like permease